jgi:hypothetical protein
VISSHLAFLARRRALRPTEEYRTPSDSEWQQFLGHFERRKVSAGLCGRAFATPCIHEHAPLTELPGGASGFLPGGNGLWRHRQSVPVTASGVTARSGVDLL